MAAARAGNVTIANAVGNGVADDKAVYAYVPDCIRYYLGEEPILPNVDTYLLWDADQRAAGARPARRARHQAGGRGSGGYGMVIGPAASDEELDDVAASTSRRTRGATSPRRSCRCRGTRRSSTTTSRAATSTCGPFVLSGESIEVIPGGLTRVALRRGSLVVNSSQGGGSKDTWVLSGDAD